MKNTERLQMGGTPGAYNSMRTDLIDDIESIFRKQIDESIAVKAAPGFADAFINSLTPIMYNTHKSGNFRSLNKLGMKFRKQFLLVMAIEEPVLMKARREKNNAFREGVINAIFTIAAVGVLAYIAIQVAIS